jgi:hypothetical protein
VTTIQAGGGSSPCAGTTVALGCGPASYSGHG